MAVPFNCKNGLHIRRVLKVDARTHSRYIALVVNNPDIGTELLARYGSFWNSCINSENKYIRFATQIIAGSQSNVANNLRLILSKLHKGYNDITAMFSNKVELKQSLYMRNRNTCTTEDISNCEAIKELLMCLDGCMDIHLTRGEVKSLLDVICTYNT